MKKMVLAAFFSTCALVGLAQNQLVVNNGEDAAFKWEHGLSYEFGTIVKDQPVSHEFAFTNTGNSPLVISSVKGSCGCTVTSYSQGPIAPGARGKVTATYNAKKLGPFTKRVTVDSNTGAPVTLIFKGEVVADIK